MARTTFIASVDATRYPPSGAASAVALVIPELKGKFNGYAVRVPTATVSLVDFAVQLGRDTTVEEILGETSVEGVRIKNTKTGEEIIQLFESLNTRLGTTLLIVGGQLPPLLEPLPRLGPFIGIHVRPLPRAVAQSLLTIRRQLIPALIEFLQQLLLLLIQLIPWHALGVGLGPDRNAPPA